jgi:phosphoserine phosphatase RsbX
MDGINPEFVVWGVAGRQMPGEMLSGDMHLVKPLENGVLVAVADGLGHGEPAAQAAELALNVVEDHAREPLVQILEHCTESLRETRGVVMSLALLDALENSLQWLGVGNVGGLLVHSAEGGKRANDALMLSNGVVGLRLPPLHPTAVKVAPGDTLVFATDGIRAGFEERMIIFEKPDETAQCILARDGLETDDALVLVATYQGRPR